MLFAGYVSLDIFVPDPSIPYEIPNFVGRDKECKAVEHHLTDEVTRLVNVWGAPGFGKTSVAIRVAHHLQEKNIPVYFASVRGMESKEDLVSKLLSMFADDKQVGHISSSHLIIQYLQQIQNPLVLILDNADDLLESGDTRRKENVLQFIEEILTHCKQIKFLLTTRESLDFLSHKLSIYLEKINVLDEISSADLVRLLLPDASDDECNCVVRECGSVPLSMRLMCSLIKEANVSINALLEEMNNSTLVDVLDIESFPNNVRLKSVIKTSFERLTFRERDAFVSLSVFPEWFGLDEAQAILNAKTEFKTKQIIRSLERKSLIDCADNFSHFTIHSLFRSFIEEETKNDQAVGNIFLNAQLQFYDYYISSCKVANENFLKRRFGDAFRSFLDQRGCIISSLLNGPRKDKIYPKAIELLSEAKSFLFVALHGEHLFENLYDMALEEAKKRGNSEDEQRLYSAKECPPCSTVKSFFWLSRVQREAGDLEGAMKSVKVGRELLGHHELDAGQQGKADLKGSMASLQRATDMKLNDDTASSYHDLGLWQRQTGRLKEALVSLKKAALLRSSELGDHEDTANSYYWLGIVQRKMGDFNGALKSAEVSLRLRKDLLGDDTNTADSFHEKGAIHYSMGDYKLAVEAFQKAGDMNFVLLGEHKYTACCYHNLGEAQSRIEDHQRALDSLQRATDMRSKVLGDHKHTALSYHILSLEQRAMGDLKGALDSLQRAANMRSKLLGDHEDTASTYHELGVVQGDMRDLKGALDSLQKAALLRSSLLGDHEDTANSYYWLGIVQRKMGDFNGALKSAEVSLRLRKDLLGDDTNTADSFHEKGAIHYSMGDYKLAVEAFQKAGDMNFVLLGEHKYTACCYHNLGEAQSRIEDHQRALDSLQRATDMRSKVLGDHKHTALSYHILSLEQRAMGDLKGALDSLQRAANMRSNLLGDHKDTASSYHELGVMQHGMGDLKGALQSLQKALDMRTNLLGDHGHTTSSLNELRAVRKKLTSGRSLFGKVFQRKNRHEK